MIYGSRIGINHIVTKTAAEFDNVRVPGGRVVKDCTEGELYSIFEKIGVPNFSHTRSHVANLQSYAELLDEIGKTAADAAIAQFLDKAAS